SVLVLHALAYGPSLMYSSNVRRGRSVDTFVAPSAGSTSSRVGGTASAGPPVGATGTAQEASTSAKPTVAKPAKAAGVPGVTGRYRIPTAAQTADRPKRRRRRRRRRASESAPFVCLRARRRP